MDCVLDYFEVCNLEKEGSYAYYRFMLNSLDGFDFASLRVGYAGGIE